MRYPSQTPIDRKRLRIFWQLKVCDVELLKRESRQASDQICIVRKHLPYCMYIDVYSISNKVCEYPTSCTFGALLSLYQQICRARAPTFALDPSESNGLGFVLSICGFMFCSAVLHQPNLPFLQPKDMARSVCKPRRGSSSG